MFLRCVPWLALVSLSLLIAAPDFVAGEDGRLYQMARRAEFTHAKDLDGKTFDYVVIGGGQAGLTVASRLSEDPDLKVAVIEAGGTGVAQNDSILIPSGNLYNSAVGTAADWKWKTTPQPGLLSSTGTPGRSADMPRGKVLGGSSAINGMYYVRSSHIEHNLWSDLIGNASDLWGWDNMFRAMKKSETFTPPTENVTSQVDVKFKKSSHGTDGPIHVSWPAVSYPSVGAFIQSASAISAPPSNDPDSGNGWGTFLATSNINPANWTRSYARTGYLDPNQARPNLSVLTGFMVSKINFDTQDKGAVTASSVTFQKKKGGKQYQVKASREVILSGGSINDPQVLQLSGIGESSFLKSKNISVVVDLPGVGHHLQDHLSAGVQFKPKNMSEIPPMKVTGNAKENSYINSATSYVNATALMKDGFQDFLNKARQNQTTAVNALDAPDAVKAGYNLTYTAVINNIFNNSSPVGIMELLHALTFGSIQVQAAMQHPLSRGSVAIKTDDVFDAPDIDPGYLNQYSDLVMLREGFKLARAIGKQAPLSQHLDVEQHPGNSVSSDESWETWIRETVGTEFHPSSTASMLPRESGGVVDKNLLVYGTKNLRVVDASVPPIAMACHLVAVTYGIAEIGSEIILSHKNDYVKTPTAAGSTSASQSKHTSTPQSKQQQQSGARKGGSSSTNSDTSAVNDGMSGAARASATASIAGVFILSVASSVLAYM
ncbi:hypothetical protein MSPP1_002674 [Malassezia sp. CBS 17886]|nr:hypothetical protein MSPP1_002674 [Malassezia sp. CBS 17886]